MVAASSQRAITTDTALRLGRYFRMSPEVWLNLQSHYDLEREKERLGHRLDKEGKVLPAAWSLLLGGLRKPENPYTQVYIQIVFAMGGRQNPIKPKRNKGGADVAP